MLCIWEWKKEALPDQGCRSVVTGVQPPPPVVHPGPPWPRAQSLSDSKRDASRTQADAGTSLSVLLRSACC